MSNNVTNFAGYGWVLAFWLFDSWNFKDTYTWIPNSKSFCSSYFVNELKPMIWVWLQSFSFFQQRMPPLRQNGNSICPHLRHMKESFPTKTFYDPNLMTYYKRKAIQTITPFSCWISHFYMCQMCLMFVENVAGIIFDIILLISLIYICKIIAIDYKHKIQKL